MAQNKICKVEVVTELQSSREKFYGFLRNNFNSLNIVFPKHITCMELLIGDAGSAGAVHFFKYVIMGVQMSIKVEVEKVDDVNNIIIYNALEGDFEQLYKSLKAVVEVKKGENGMAGSVNWTFEYEKVYEGAPDADPYADFAAMLCEGLDAYLLSN